MNNKSIEIYYNNQLVENRNIYNTHDNEDNEFQNISKLIDEFGSSSKAILMYDYQCIDKIIVPFHWHDWVEIVYLDSGKMDVMVENSMFRLSKNQFCYFPSGIMHKTVGHENSRIVVIHLKKEYLKKRMPNWENYSINIEKICDKNNIEEKEKLGLTIKELYRVYNSDKTFHIQGYEGLLDYIIFLLVDKFGEMENENYVISEKYKERLLKIFDYIDNNLFDKIELNDLASYLNVSPQYLSKLFRTYLNLTFTDYVNGKRLQLAELDILNTDLSLIEIAFKFGFPNYQSFLHTFRKKYDISPSEFRKKHQNKQI
ncbi:AraC family transcriptional regulator [Helcococcus kunzii]|uniref:AraC family transcriptional regulator n=1 Tax=Helcococcus kunzii TaxID=40091 RepID=UPI0024ADB950|nr:AraC family transcriptional regulator [Helcococcus kunzii]